MAYVCAKTFCVHLERRPLTTMAVVLINVRSLLYPKQHQYYKRLLGFGDGFILLEAVAARLARPPESHRKDDTALCVYCSVRYQQYVTSFAANWLLSTGTDSRIARKTFSFCPFTWRLRLAIPWSPVAVYSMNPAVFAEASHSLLSSAVCRFPTSGVRS